VVSSTPGARGGFGANHHLRQSLVFLNMPVLQQPEAYIGGADKLFADDGSLANEGTREFLRGFMNAFGRWIATVLRTDG
jgi:chromate reductase